MYIFILAILYEPLSAIFGTQLSLLWSILAEIVFRCPKTGNFLVFNGEIYAGLPIETHENDGLALLRQLGGSAGNEQEILSTLSALQGEFAFIFYEKSRGDLWICKDKIGRFVGGLFL